MIDVDTSVRLDVITRVPADLEAAARDGVLLIPTMIASSRTVMSRRRSTSTPTRAST